MDCCFGSNGLEGVSIFAVACQFADEAERYEVDGRHYCRFHLPVLDEAGRPTIKDAWRLSDHRRFFLRLRRYAEMTKATTGKPSFCGVVFPVGCTAAMIFGREQFIPTVDFTHCVFVGRARFRKAVFEGRAGFSHAEFAGAAEFQHAVINGQMDCENAIFRKRAGFDGVDFLYNANFDNTVFEGNASFEGASFGSWTSFDKVEFQSGTSFDYAAFNNGLRFRSARFLKWTSFQVRTEQNRQWNVKRGFAQDDDANERQDRNFPQINFTGASFGDRIDFSNRHFLEVTEFTDVTFAVAPEFHNCVLHQDTDFSGCQFRDTKSNHAARAYRTLKLAMGDVRARNEEARFYALEQDALRRRNDTPLSIKVMSWTYMAISDYGRDYVRPLLILALTTCLSSVGYWQWEAAVGGAGDAIGGVAFAVKQIVRPFFIWTLSELGQSELMAVATQWPLALRLVATLQSIGSIGLIALFLLSVRRQFRLH